MGQKCGKALYCQEVQPFLNLSEAACKNLVILFRKNLYEGFGLDLSGFVDFIKTFKDDIVTLDDESLDDAAEKLFHKFDTDRNGFIDSLEMIATLSYTAAFMREEKKYEFIFKCFDFQETKSLSFDETVFAFQSVVLGLLKISINDISTYRKNDVVHDEIGLNYDEKELYSENPLPVFEKYTTMIFQRIYGQGPWLGNVTIDSVVEFCLGNYECSTWMCHYGEPAEPWVDPMDLNVSNGKIVSINNPNKGTSSKTKKGKWRQVADSLTPSAYLDKRKHIPSSPNSQLELEWAYGFQLSDKSKNNIKYNINGDVVYHCGKISIVYSRECHVQKHFTYHQNKIVALDIHPNLTYVATGDDGKVSKSSIIIWDSTTLEVIKYVDKTTFNGISFLKFNHTGDLLACISPNPNPCIFVYKWEDAQTIFSSILSTQVQVYDILFDANDTIITCGEKHIIFWPKDKKKQFRKQCKRGIFGKEKYYNNVQLCLSSHGNQVISGTDSGDLFIWKGRNLSKVVKAHNGAIESIQISNMNIITGGSDRLIYFWTPRFGLRASFDVRSFSSTAMIRSIHILPKSSQFLVGTTTGIFELSMDNGSNIHVGPLIEATGAISGSAAHPLKEEFCTVGQDGVLRIWDIKQKQRVRSTDIKSPIQCVSYSQSGTFMVIGYGPDSSEKRNISKDGAFAIIQDSELTIVHEAKDSNSTILDGKFEGQKLALCSRDQSIYIYNTVTNFSLHGVINCRRGAVSNLDFSEGGSWIQAMSKDHGELFFVSLEDLKVETSASFIKDLPFESQTCSFGWLTKGVWSSCSNLVTVNSCDRSEGENCLAVGYSDGRLGIFPYPCYDENSEFYVYSGHSSISKVLFANGDSHLISTSDDDMCIFQWCHREFDDCVENDEQTKSKFEKKVESISRHENIRQAVNSLDHEFFLTQEDDDIYHLSLERVLTSGYSEISHRSNVKYSSTGKIVYPSSNTIILYDANSETQHFTDIVNGSICTAIAISPCRNIIASGYSGKCCMIRLYGCHEDLTLCEIPLQNHIITSSLTFDPSGSILASLENNASSFYICLYYWCECVKITKSYCGSCLNTNGIIFSPNLELIQYGNGFCKIWDLSGGTNIHFEPINHGLDDTEEFLSISFCYMEQEICTCLGSSGGYIHVIKDLNLDMKIKAHDGPINTISTLSPTELLSGGEDGVIKQWRLLNNYFECHRIFEIETSSSKIRDPIWSIDISLDKRDILVNTKKNRLFEVSIDSTFVDERVFLVGHHGKGVNCVDVYPNIGVFMTAGRDGSVRFWDLTTYKLKKIIDHTGHEFFCCSFSHNGLFAAAAGSKNIEDEEKSLGSLVVHSSKDMRKIFEEQYPMTVSSLCFSPLDNIIAISSGIYVYLHNIKKGFIPIASVPHSSRQNISQIIFSKDSKYMKIVDVMEKSEYVLSKNGQIVKKDTAALKRHYEFSDDSNKMKKTAKICRSLPIGTIVPFRDLSRADLTACIISTLDNVSQVIVAGNGNNCVMIFSLRKQKLYHGHVFDRFVFKNTNVSSIDDRMHCKGEWEDEISSLAIDYPKNISDCYCIWYDHTYSTQNKKVHLKYNKYGEIVHTSSDIGIITSLDKISQSFFSYHEGEIKNIYMTSDRDMIASIDDRKIILRDISVGKPISTIDCSSSHQISFSPDKRYIVIAKNIVNKSDILVYRTQTLKWDDPVCVSKKTVPHVQEIMFLGLSNFPLLCMCRSKVVVIEKGQASTIDVHEFEIPETVNLTALCTVPADVNRQIVLGQKTGKIALYEYLSGKLELKRSVDAHTGIVSAIHCSRGYIFSAGDDLRIIQWDFNLSTKKIFEFGRFQNNFSVPLQIESIDENENSRSVLVCSKFGEMYEMSCDSQILYPIPCSEKIVEGDFSITNNPVDSNQFAICGTDSVLRICDLKEKRAVRRKSFDFSCCALCWTSKGEHIIVGCKSSSSLALKDGSFVVLDTDSLDIKYTDRISKQCIRDIKYGVNGDIFAMGSDDGRIYLHDLSSYNLIWASQTLSSSICNLDFSSDGAIIRAATSTNQVYFLKTKDGSNIPASNIGDVTWFTYNCPLCWSGQGNINSLNEKCLDFEIPITSIDKHEGTQLIAFSNKVGRVGIIRFPFHDRNDIFFIHNQNNRCQFVVRFNVSGEYLLVMNKQTGRTTQFHLKKIGR